MHETKTPKVNEVNEFLEIASDFEDPLEVIRESLSNSYDAHASELTIEIEQHPEGSKIIVDDDGDGMGIEELESFFDLGNSTKGGDGDDSIGYKGHGTKIFYKSERISVTTATKNGSIGAVMERPWEKLNNGILPEYDVTSVSTGDVVQGTHIEITGFKSGQGFEPSSLTYNKVEHYLKWKTLAGSTAYHFDPKNFRDLEVTIKLDQSIDPTQSELKTTNKLEFPSEQIEPTDGRFPAARMCKHYGPREIKVEASNGDTTTVQVVGMIGGQKARDELPTYGRHSAQFGVWLAKDHIKVERINEAISHDNEFLHFFFIANCQDIELSANREKIRNKSGSVYQTIVEELSYYLSKVSSDPWFKQYLHERRDAELARKAQSQLELVEKRKERIQERTRFEPSNQSEIILALERLNDQETGPTLRVEDFDPDADVTAIVRENNILHPVSIRQQLTDHFEADKPLESISKVVCWSLGDRDKLNQIERDGYQGGHISFDLEQKFIAYQTDEAKNIQIVELSTLLTEPEAVEAAD